MKMPKKDTILGIVASIVLILIGYLVWKHENKVTQAEASANNAIASQQESDLENELSNLQSDNSQYGSTGYGGVTGDVAPTADDSSMLASLLDELLGTGTGASGTSGTSASGASGASGTGASGTSGASGTGASDASEASGASGTSGASGVPIVSHRQPAPTLPPVKAIPIKDKFNG